MEVPRCSHWSRSDRGVTLITLLHATDGFGLGKTVMNEGAALYVR